MTPTIRKLLRVSHEVEAAAIVTALAAQGIKASTTGSFTAGFRAEAPGYISVIVRRDDLDSARQVLAGIEREQADVDWSQVDVGDGEEA